MLDKELKFVLAKDGRLFVGTCEWKHNELCQYLPRDAVQAAAYIRDAEDVM